MKILFLYGIGCTTDIWKNIREDFKNDEMEEVSLPRDLTLNSSSLHQLSQWIYEKYQSIPYDVLIGHSMGGILALQLVHDFGFKPKKIILIETALVPQNVYYRNLLTDEHMRLYGNETVLLIQEEMVYYDKTIIQEIRDSFDFTNLLTNHVHLIYGDRNKINPSRIQDLNLNASDLEKVTVHFVRNAAHLPMIENPKDLVLEIQKILNS